MLGISNFHKWFDVAILDFEIEFCIDILHYFQFWRHFGLLFEKLGNFSPKLLATLNEVQNVSQ
jgi:hypothetical protein